MMEEDLRILVKAALPGAVVDWGDNAQSAGLPRATLMVVSAPQSYTSSGPIDMRQARIQVDLYAASYGAARALARALVSALGGHRDSAFGGVFVDAERDMPTEAGAVGNVYRITIDLMVNHKEQ